MVPAAGGPPPTAAESCAPVLGATLEPFGQHLKFAHLERSFEDQVKDISGLDQYVDMHATLVQTMIAPLQGASGGAAGGTLDPFFAHLRFAHLERSPEDQLKDIRNVDRYVKTHTVLVETMAAPATGALGGCTGPAPAPQGPGPMPEPRMPGHAPAQEPAPAPEAPPPPAAEPAPAGAMEVGVMVMGNAFAPGSVQAAPGGTVAWTNMDAVPHTVTGGTLQSSALNQGGVFSHTFDSPGTFAYYCAIHPDMKGAVVVGG